MVTSKPVLGLGLRLGALAAMLVCGGCWSEDPKIVAYDAGWSDKLKEACNRPKTPPREDGLVRLDEMECESLALWPSFENEFVSAFKVNTACKGIMLISYQKLATERGASKTVATKELRWDFSAWPVWRFEGRSVLRDDRQDWFIIDSKSKASAAGTDSLHDMATSVCTFVNERSG